MKNFEFKYILIFAAIVSVILFATTLDTENPTSVATSTHFEIPELLVRNDKMRNTIEWESRVNKVNKHSSDLIKNPNNASAYLGLATEFSKEARVTGEHGYYYPAVLDLTDQALAQESISPDLRFEALRLKAHTLLSQHQFDGALEVAEQALAENGSNVDLYTALVDVNVELGNYDKAAEYAQKLVDLKPGLISYARASYIRQIFGDMDGAIWAMEQAVEAGYPGFENTEWARITLAELFLETDHEEKAIVAYEQSLAHRPDYPFALAGIAAIHRTNGEYVKAEALLLQALAAVPEIGFQEELYLTYRDMGMHEKADEAFAGIIEMLEDDIAHGHRMDMEYAYILLDYKNDPTSALTYAQKEYDMRPANIDVNILMAEIMLKSNKKAEAKKYLEAAKVTGTHNVSIAQLEEELNV